MGSIHNELRRGQLSAALTRALGADKGADGIERFGETMQPVMDLWFLPEWAYLRNEWLMVAQTGNPAVAAELSATALVNPANSGVLAMVEMVNVRTSTATGSASLRLASAAAVAATLTFTGRGTARDFRVFNSTVGGAPGVIEYWIGSDPGAIGGMLEDLGTPNNTAYQLFQSTPYIIAPGQALVVQLAAVNTILLANYAWRERKALPGELD